jgi:ribokinase
VAGREWIAVVGSINADVAVWTPVVPGDGETVLGTRAAVFAGGKGANQAVQAARLGAAVRLVGRIGRDVLGDLVAQSLTDAGVDVTSVARDDEEGTGVASIWIDRSGSNRIIVAPQANGRLAPADVDASREVVTGAKLLLVQLEVPLETVEHAVVLAAESHVPVLLNPAPARALRPELLARVEWLVPNEPEAAVLAGLQSTLDAARALRAGGPRSIVVTLGSEGALVASEDGEQHVPAVPVEDVVDTTAAGDAFCGALAVGLASGQPLADAVRLANAAGAVAVARAGAQPSLGDRAAIEEALRRPTS